jgi:hypothetical protein
MKEIISVLTLIFCAITINAQTTLSASWLRHSCGYTNGVNLLGGDVWGNAVCADNFGNSYNSGNSMGFWFTMDTIIEMQDNRFYINKYNSSGQRIWTAKAKGTTLNSIMTSTRMECDSTGNIYLCGNFSVDDSVYMAPYWYPVGGGYIAKYDSSGNNIWCRYISRNGTAGVSFTDMSLANGYIYACGIANYGNVIFGTDTFTTIKSQNGFITKLDFNGNIIHSELLDSNSTNEIYGIEVSRVTNDVFIVGEYINDNLSVDGYTLTNTPFATNSFIIKMNNGLTAQWAKKCNTYLHINQTVGSGTKALKRVALDKLDNLYVVANGNGDSTVIGNLSFNHRISPNGSYAQDIYMVKLDQVGNEIWLRHGGSDEMDFVSDMATDEWGNTILAVSSGSQSTSGLIFGMDTIQQWWGGLVKYDPNGNLLYTQKLQENKTLNALAMSKDSVFYGTGSGKITTQAPFINIPILACEDTTSGYNNPPFKMVMVKFFDNSGSFSTAIQNVNYLGYSIDIFPNPTESILNVNFNTNNNKNKLVRVLDVTGKLLIVKETKSNLKLSTNNLASGMYYINITEDDKSKTIKFIKQ